MPVSRYNKAFGGKRGSAAKAKRAMRSTYGSARKAEQVFYATVNERLDEKDGRGGLRRAVRRESRARKKGSR